MKVALVHDYIKEYGGAERVLEALHEIWPEATVFTSVYLPKFLGPHKRRFDGWKIIPSNAQKMPFIEKLISPLRLFSPWIFENWNFDEFDLIIVSATGAYIPNLIIRKPETIHLCYCHTPPRYLYGYPTARDLRQSVIRKGSALLFTHWLRQLDFISSQRPDYYIANSHETKSRISKFYRRDANVIYPPVEMVDKLNTKYQIQNTKYKTKKYFLTGGRLARAKNIDLAIEACNKLNLPLKIFGRGFADYGNELRKIAGPTVEFLGEVSDEELISLYSQAKALLFPSEQEDFGIMPVESQACGTPVIGLNQGGVKETVIDGQTGILFNNLTPDDLISAIKRFNDINHRSIRTESCKKQAKKFSKVRFKKEMKNFVTSLIHARPS